MSFTSPWTQYLCHNILSVAATHGCTSWSHALTHVKMDYHLFFFVICFCILVCTISTTLSDRTYFPAAFLTTTLCSSVCKFVEQMLCQSECQLRNMCKLGCISFCSVVCVCDVRCARPVNAHSAHMSTFSVIKFDFISNFPYGNLIYASHQASNRLPSQYPYTNMR